MEKYLLISEKPSLMVEVMKAFPKSKTSKKIQVDSYPLHGHCCTLAEPEFYDDKYSDRFNIDNLPVIPDEFKHVSVDKKITEEIRKKVKENNYDGFINCCDPEREGQNIFWSLMDYLNLKDEKVLRFWLEDTTQEKLIQAWDNLRDESKDEFLKNLTSASLLRAEFDWLIGMNSSRATGISSGRVMTPVEVSILAKREEEIKNFKPENAYDVYAQYDGFQGKYQKNKDDKEEKEIAAFKKEEEAIDFIKGLSKEGKVLKCETKQVKENAPLLYSLGELQSDANKHFGYSASATLGIIQKLYDAPLSLLTYPRTDSSYITEAIAKNDWVRMLKACTNVPELEKIVPSKEIVVNFTKSKYVNNKKVGAHAAITLTGKPFDYKSLTKEQQNIMSLVAKRMMSTVLNPAIYSDTNLEVDINGNLFKTKQKILINPGYLSLHDKKVETGLDFSKIRVGDVINVNNFDIKKVTTTCPPRYNDASLLKAMINVGNTLEDKEMAEVLKGVGSPDQGGIGTPATRSAIIDKLLIQRSYKGKKDAWVTLKGKSYYVTDFGMEVANRLKKFPVSSALLTAEWEKKLREVEEGKKDENNFRKEMKEFVKELTEEMKKNRMVNSKSSATLVAGLNCPFCGSPIKETNKAFFCENNKDCGFVTAKTMIEPELNVEDLKKIFEEGKSDPKVLTAKNGKQYNILLTLNNEERKLGFEFEQAKQEDTGVKCKCKKDTLKKVKGKYGYYYHCNNCGLNLDEKPWGHKLTKKEVETLMTGEMVELRSLKGKTGKEFNANVKIGNNKIEIVDFVN